MRYAGPTAIFLAAAGTCFVYGYAIAMVMK